MQAKAAIKQEKFYPLAKIIDDVDDIEEEVPGKKFSAYKEGDKLIVVMFNTPQEIKKFIETIELTEVPAMKAVFVMPQPQMQIISS